MITQEKVLAALSNVEEPDLKKDLVTLNMIRDVAINGKEVSFSVVLTTPACPLKAEIERACRNAIIHFVDKDAVVKVNMTSNVTTHRTDNMGLLSGVRNIIAVSSGKGGVGKSTVAANLAVALAMSGARVGLIDADIYGPSIPIMFGVQNEHPLVREEGERIIMLPIERYGVKLLSVGFMLSGNQSVVWRGPMASRALQQLFGDADWGELDYLVVDLPPGTGDIHLTLVQSVPVTGAIVVTTPQDVAMADAAKGIDMFRKPNINVPVLGIVENMSWFTPAELPNNKYYIFGKDGALRLSKELNVPLLGQIPIVQSIREASDAGCPEVLNIESPSSVAFRALAERVAQEIAITNANRKEASLTQKN